MKQLALRLIRYYQALPIPALHNSCRFIPTCSEYTYQMIEKYGIVSGSLQGFKRIVSCNPFTKSNYS